MADKAKVKVGDNMVEGEGTEGVWLTFEKSKHHDVHIYHQGNRMVVGQNDYSTTNKFSNPAIVFEDDKISMQYADKDGNPKNVDVDPKLFAVALVSLLKRVQKNALKPAKPKKAVASAEPQEKEEAKDEQQ